MAYGVGGHQAVGAVLLECADTVGTAVLSFQWNISRQWTTGN